MALKTKFATDRHQPDGEWVQATTVEKVQGVHHRKDDAAAFANAARTAERKKLAYGLQLVHEPNNPHDPNAIAVNGVAETKGLFKSSMKDWRIGYLDAGLAAEMVAEFVSQDIPIAAELVYIYESASGFLDFNLLILAPPGHSMSSRMKRKK